MSQDKYHQLEILEVLDTHPEITQADLAARVGVAVGTVNWYLKQWSKKGLLKIRRIGRWRWEYILTPKGMAEKTRLASKYLEHSMRIYRKIRGASLTALKQVKGKGYQQVVIQSNDEVADICSLTCLEMGIRVSEENNPNIPKISTHGYEVSIFWPDEDNE